MTSAADRSRLRAVVAEYAEIVSSGEMATRRERWRLTNRLLERTVPFHIEDNGSFFADLTPPPQCEGEFERGCEAHFLRCITNHRLIPDDRVFPASFWIHWHIGRTSACPELQYHRVPDSTGRELGYETNTPLADLATGLARLRPTEFSVDREGTHRTAGQAAELFGDLLPVEIVGHGALAAGTGMAGQAVHLMGMDNFYVNMLDQPDNVHRFFALLAEDAERYADWLEAEGLITVNGRELDCGSGSCVYSDELPRREIAPGESVRLSDIWGFIEAQEAVGLSPEMYAEFIHPYQRRVGDRYGLINYGCCEPTHHFWPSLSGFANLRKLTVSPWCDVESIAASVGRQVVLSRKPHPLKLCGPRFDPEDFAASLRETLA
ncbi:MAG: hypothetical protein FJX74_00970, partial [Armatimonadetes bacterium]|nr:hypothetical protein [Armatimonadota bacterium]